MSKKLFFVFLFFLLVGAFSVSASADEVVLIPVDSVEFTAKSTYSNYESNVYFEVERSSWTSPFTNTNWYLGPRDQVDSPSDGVYLYPSSGNTEFIQGVTVVRAAYSYHGYQFSDFSVIPLSLVVNLDMSNLINGYYRYECDFEFGVGFVVDPFQYTSGDNDLIPNYVYNSVPLHIADSDSGMHISCYFVGQDNFTVLQRADGVGASLTTGLPHFHCVSTFYYDSQYGTDVTFDLTPIFSNMIGSLSYDMSPVRDTNRSQAAYAIYNNRFWSSLYSNVEPPVTPTPVPTPYPGQDTQESINQGVQTIIHGLDLNATPIPTPVDLSIDETFFDSLDEMTLPDLSAAESTYLSLWDIFNPLWPFIGILVASLFVVAVFCWLLRGGFI